VEINFAALREIIKGNTVEINFAALREIIKGNIMEIDFAAPARRGGLREISGITI
jgi:hypothetical protein